MANSTGLSLTSINLLWWCLEVHPPRGSCFLLFSPTVPIWCVSLQACFIFLLPFHSLLLTSHSASQSPPSCFLSSFHPSSSSWPHPRTKSLSCQPMRRERGRCELVRSEINKARTGWTIYPEKMYFVMRMGTAIHKSCHPGCLLGKACWSFSSLSSSSGESKGLTVSSYVNHPITASGTDKSILAGMMKGTLMHVHVWDGFNEIRVVFVIYAMTT